MPKNTTQCPQPGFKPGLLALDLSALTMRPPRLVCNWCKTFCLQFRLQPNGQLKQFNYWSVIHLNLVLSSDNCTFEMYDTTSFHLWVENSQESNLNNCLYSLYDIDTTLYYNQTVFSDKPNEYGILDLNK